MVDLHNFVLGCGNLLQVILLALLRSVPTAHSGSVSLVSLSHSSIFQRLPAIPLTPPNSPMRWATISSVSSIPCNYLIYRLVNFHMVPLCRHTPLINCLFWPVFHPGNGVLMSCNWLLSGRKYKLD